MQETTTRPQFRPAAGIITAAVLVLGLAGSPATLSARQQETISSDEVDPSGTLHLRVILVTKNLDLKPVPRKRFLIISESIKHADWEISTDFFGEVKIPLPPGRHRIISADDIRLDGEKFSWSVPFEIRTGKETTLGLSNDNATVTRLTTPPGCFPLNEARLFKRLKDGVFEVTSDLGRGSGFLVHPEGLILTNHHLVRNAGYLAAITGPKDKYRAVLVAVDEANDLAVLRVHPAAVRDLPVFELADDPPENPTIAVGERIIAVASPLVNEITLASGLINRIEPEAVFSDVEITPGNSGGPVFDLNGRVIGVNTTALTTANPEPGPGRPGIVRIHLAKPLIVHAIERMNSLPTPAPGRLPVPTDLRFTPDLLSRIAPPGDLDDTHYHLQVGNFDVQILTPALLAHLRLVREGGVAAGRATGTRSQDPLEKYVPGRDFYDWPRHAADLRPVLILQAIPEIALTWGSVASVVLLDQDAPQRYKSKVDFERMELYRDGVLVQPIHPGRGTLARNSGPHQESMTEIGFYGVYEYPPETLRPGAELELQVWEKGYPGPEVVTIPADAVNAIWFDLEPYLLALERAGNTDVAPGPPSVSPRILTTEELIVWYLRDRAGWVTGMELMDRLRLSNTEYGQALHRLETRGLIEEQFTAEGPRFRLKSSRSPRP